MKCSKCLLDFEDKYIDESHDVPCYLFFSMENKKEKKQLADKFPRHHLCKGCHKDYELGLHMALIVKSMEYSEMFFEVQG